MLRKLVLTAVLGSSLVTTAGFAAEDPTAPPVNTPGEESTSSVSTDYEVDKRRDIGWNGPWGLVFQLNNIFVAGGFLSAYQGLGLAGAFMFNEDFMLRGGVSLSRTHSPPLTTETTTETAGTVVKTYTVVPGASTSSAAVTARADALYRLTRNKVAPYVGAGPYVTFSHTRLNYDDDVSVPDVVTVVRNHTNTVTFGLRGLVGAEWRLHPNFAVFAEYNVTVDVITYTDIDNRTTVTSTQTGTETVTSTRQERNTPAWANLSTAMNQGASLGLLVLF